MVSPVHVLVLSVQAGCAWSSPRLRAPVIVIPCISPAATPSLRVSFLARGVAYVTMLY